MSGIFTGVGSPGTVSAASGGFFLAFNGLTTSPIQVLPQDPQRKSVTFHNPDVVDVLVAPVFIQNSGSDVPLSPSPGALGGCFRIFANGGTLTLSGEVQKPFQAFTATGAGSLTVMPSHV